MSEIERCDYPLGSSEALSARCVRLRGHDGEHRSAFECGLEGAVERLRELRALLGEGADLPGIGPGGIRVVLDDVIGRIGGQ